jgi:hypothetical protein
LTAQEAMVYFWLRVVCRDEGIACEGHFLYETYFIPYGCSCQVVGSVADPHHLDADPDPDPVCHFDPDPRFQLNPDPNPSFQRKAQNLEKVLK